MSFQPRVSMNAQRFYLALSGLILAAWGVLIAWQRSAYAELLGHESLGDGHISPLLSLAGFLMSWILMTVAMMLPGSLPLLYHHVPSLQKRMAAVTILGYLSPWVLFGLLLYLGDNFLHHMTEPGASLAAYAVWIVPGIMLLAGIYQLTPLKRSALALCQPAHSPSLSGNMDRTESGGLSQGLRLGVVCVGSCWPLMLLMFAIGHHQLGWMLVFGGIMAAERLAPWGRRLSWVVGLALVVWATLWALGIQHGGLH